MNKTKSKPKNTPHQPPVGVCPPATCSASLALQIAELQSTLRPLLNQMSDFKSAERKALSREFIAANSSKKWAGWNGRIYHHADLANGGEISYWMPMLLGRTLSYPTTMTNKPPTPEHDLIGTILRYGKTAGGRSDRRLVRRRSMLELARDAVDNITKNGQTCPRDQRGRHNTDS